MFFTSRYIGLRKVISGGQTGADQGGLLAAHRLGVLTGGTAPKGFMTSKGPNLLLSAFGLMDHGTLQTRTKQNVQDSDGTVVLSGDLESAGTVLTIRLCKELNKPVLVLDIKFTCSTFGDTGGLPADTIDDQSEALHAFVLQHQIATLNVAGNRERFEDCRTTHVTRIIVERAMRLLDLDGMLVRDSDL